MTRWGRTDKLTLLVGWPAVVSAALTLWVIVQRGPTATIGALDHSPGFFEDFRIYLEQAKGLLSTEPALHDGWSYPPFSALAFLPFAKLSTSTAYALWAGVQGALCVGLVVQCARYLKSYPAWQRMLFAAGLVLSSLPVLHCMKWGQLSILVILLAVLGLETWGWWGTAMLSIAVSLKLYPICFAALYVLRERARPLLRLAALVSLLSLAVPLLTIGYAKSAMLWRGATSAIDNFASESTLSSQALSTSIDKWFAPRGVVAGSPAPVFFTLPAAARSGLTILATLALVSFTALAAHRRRHSSISLDAVSVILCTSILVKPGWVHYFAALPLGQALILQHAKASWPATLLCALSLTLTAVPLLVSLRFPPFFYVTEYYALITVSALCCLTALWLCNPDSQPTPSNISDHFSSDTRTS